MAVHGGMLSSYEWPPYDRAHTPDSTHPIPRPPDGAGGGQTRDHRAEREREWSGGVSATDQTRAPRLGSNLRPCAVSQVCRDKARCLAQAKPLFVSGGVEKLTTQTPSLSTTGPASPNPGGSLACCKHG